MKEIKVSIGIHIGVFVAMLLLCVGLICLSSVSGDLQYLERVRQAIGVLSGILWFLCLVFIQLTVAAVRFWWLSRSSSIGVLQHIVWGSGGAKGVYELPGGITAVFDRRLGRSGRLPTHLLVHKSGMKAVGLYLIADWDIWIRFVVTMMLTTAIMNGK